MWKKTTKILLMLGLLFVGIFSYSFAQTIAPCSANSDSCIVRSNDSSWYDNEDFDERTSDEITAKTEFTRLYNVSVNLSNVFLLQRKINDIWCISITEDGKMGNDTIRALQTCVDYYPTYEKSLNMEWSDAVSVWWGSSTSNSWWDEWDTENAEWDKDWTTEWWNTEGEKENTETAAKENTTNGTTWNIQNTASGTTWDTTWNTTQEEKRECTDDCCGIKLNTTVPFIGNCIEFNETGVNEDGTTVVNQINAFPRLMWWLSKILMTAIFVFSFIMVIAAGVMMTTWAIKWVEWNYTKWVEILTKVITSLILLGMMGLILNTINPNFFT